MIKAKSILMKFGKKVVQIMKKDVVSFLKNYLLITDVL